MLQKQTITIPLGLGVNTKTDEKLVEQGAFNLVCENATFEKVGSVKKRLSYKTLSTSYYNQSDSWSGAVSGDYSLLANYPTCAASYGKSLFLRNPVGEYWYLHEGNFIYNNSHPLPEFKISSITALAPATTVDHSDTDYDSYENMVIAVAREGNQSGSISGEASNKSTMVLYDLTTESKVLTESINNGATASSFGFVRCGFTRFADESYYYNVTVDSDSNLQIKIFNKYGQKHPTSFTISNIRTAGTVNVGGIAVCRSSNDQVFYILANTTTDNVAKFIAITGATKSVETTFSTSLPFMTSMTAKYSSDLVYLGYDDRQIILNTNGTINTADTAIAGASFSSMAYDQDSVNVIVGGVSGGYSSWTGGVQSVENYNTVLMSDKVTISSIPIVIGKCDYGQNVNDEATYFALGYAGGSGKSGEKTYARFSATQAIEDSRDTFYQYIPARFAKISSNKCVIALPKFAARNGSSFSYQLQLFFFEVNQDYKSNSRSMLGKNLHFQGGYVSEFDGVTLMENGIHTPPFAPTLVTTSAGSLTGTYSYKVVIKHTDKNGQITRSAPSGAASTGSITSKQVDISLNANPFGVKVKSCSVEIYRNTNGGTTYYYLTEVAVDMYSGQTITLYSDNTSDSSITTNALIYTSGDVLQNDPGPPCGSVIQGGNRLILIGLEDENEIAYSKKKLFGETVNFSDFFRVRIDTSQYNISGGCTAGGYMDGKLIIFKKNSIFYIAGDGPNELGVNDSFTVPELISADTGCTEPRSVVLSPLGLMFKSTKGIHILDRALSTSYIGAPVEEFNSYKVVSACLLDEKNQVIFSVISDDATKKYQLVFDYYTQQWSVYTGLRALDADVLDGEHMILDSSLKAPQVQNGADYLDNAATISQRVKTPWIKVSGLQDFGRIWTATILGKYKSAHTLNVKAYYDYDEGYYEEFNITPSVTDDQYQYRIHLKKQKCESIQFEIQDTNQTGESMELTALTLEVGLRKGSFKINAGRKY